MADIAVVTVNFNSANLIEQNAALQGYLGRIDVIVVDNYSSERALHDVRSLCSEHRLLLVESERNVGFGAAVNMGVHLALERGARHVLLLNPDASIAADQLLRLVGGLPASRPIAVSPALNRIDGTSWFQGSYFRPFVVEAGHGSASHDVPWLTAACLLFTAEAWRLGGEFDENLFLYWEDVELTVRWKQAGVELRIESTVCAVHDAGGTQSTSGKSPLYYRYMARNRLLFARSNLSPWRRAVAVLLTPLYWRILLRHAAGSSLRLWGQALISCLRGTLEGVAALSDPRRARR